MPIRWIPDSVCKDVGAASSQFIGSPCAACFEAVMQIDAALFLHQGAELRRQGDHPLARFGLWWGGDIDIPVLLQFLDGHVDALNGHFVRLNVNARPDLHQLGVEPGLAFCLGLAVDIPLFVDDRVGVRAAPSVLVAADAAIMIRASLWYGRPPLLVC